MPARLTKEERLQRKEGLKKQYKDLRNIDVLVGPYGEVSFYARVRKRGFIYEQVFDRVTDAQNYRDEKKTEIRNASSSVSSSSAKHTLAQLIDVYKKDYLENEDTVYRSPKDIIRHLEWWKAQIGHLKLQDVNTALLANLHRELKKTKSPQTAKKHLNSLSSMFKTAISQYDWMRDNPALTIVMSDKNKQRDRQQEKYNYPILTTKEQEALINACKNSRNKHLYLIVAIALTIGARKSEILGLQWENINLDKGTVTFTKTKNRKKRTIELQPEIVELLKEHKEEYEKTSIFVFPNTDGLNPIKIQSAWATALTRAKIKKGFRFHDLRHNCASHMAMSQVPLAEVSAMLGHSSISITADLYSHFFDEYTAKISRKMNSEYLKGIV